MKRFLKAGWMAGWLLAALPCPAGWIFDGRPSTWEGIPEELLADEYIYPVFLLELGGQWTDFELKASTNNFATSRKEYFVQSHKFSTSGYGDTNVWVYFTDNYAAESMRWTRATNGMAIAQQVCNVVSSKVSHVVVQPSHECQVAWTAWMSRHNDRLVWSYIRYDGANLDDHWRPVVPVEWRKGRIAP